MTVAAPRIPACMDADEYALWARGNGVATGTKNGARVFTGRAESPCDDCPLGYAAEMRAIGRCDGTPGGVEEDEPMETPETYETTTTSAPVATRTRVTVVAPCESCVHARVCRLRPDAELDVRVSLPELATELTVTLTATVDCMEYVGAPGKARPKKEQTPAQREASILSAAKARAAMAAKRAAGRAETGS